MLEFCSAFLERMFLELRMMGNHALISCFGLQIVSSDRILVVENDNDIRDDFRVRRERDYRRSSVSVSLFVLLFFSNSST